MSPRDTRPTINAASRICRLCWKRAAPGYEMFIVVGMTPDPLLVCPKCAESVLSMGPSAAKTNSESEVTPLQSETLF
jgi:hypothetical protein